MKHGLQSLPLILVSALLFTNCATPAANERLERRLDRREERVSNRLDRATIRSDARSSRWQRMKSWEEDRYNRMWDNIMAD